MGMEPAGNRPELETVAAGAREYLDRMDEAREKALDASRQIIRAASTIIKHVHRGQVEQAEALLGELGAAVAELNEQLSATPSLWFAGFVTDGLKEYVEAHLTLCALEGRPFPTPEDLGVVPPTYLNGLAETIGEMRRHSLDLIRQGKPQEAEATLEQMDEFYALLLGFDYPEAVSLGLRRRTDAARGLVERTRGDVTNALQQARLEEKMAQLWSRIGDE